MEEITEQILPYVNTTTISDRSAVHMITETCNIANAYRVICAKVVDALAGWLKENISAKDSLISILHEIQYGDEWAYRHMCAEVCEYVDLNKIDCDVIALSANINTLIYFGSQYTIYAKKLINMFAGTDSYHKIVECAGDCMNVNMLADVGDCMRKEFCV